MKKTGILLIALLLILPVVQLNGQKFKGLARTPQMGWNTWNKFGGNIDEKLIRETADLMVAKGLADAGYLYLNIDDCWQGERDSLGFITANSEKFPSGMKTLGDYIHYKGLKFGIYSDAGSKTCGGLPGSLGHEYQDALIYAKWGVDYLKYDWCNTKNLNPVGAYTLMRDALFNAGRPVLFSMCEWGDNKPWLWAKEVGHSWRTTGDIWCCFDCIKDHGTWKSLGVMKILDLQDGLRKYAGPGHWNDPDMLQVGNGMSVNEDRAHFTMWCMIAAPLILGNDLAAMSDETLGIITNRDVIAIDQDTLGIQGFKVATEEWLEFWLKPLAGGSWAFCILNRNTDGKNCKIDWNKFSTTDNLSGREISFGSTMYNVRNLWTQQEDGNTSAGREVTVPGHDVLLYRLDPVYINSIGNGDNLLWKGAGKPYVDVISENRTTSAFKEAITIQLLSDSSKILATYVKKVNVPSGKKIVTKFNFKLSPGFYRVVANGRSGIVKKFNIGYEPEKIVSPVDYQPDFKEFWDKAKADLSLVKPDYCVRICKDSSTANREVFEVKMRSLGGEEISGYLVKPAEKGKYPAIITYMGYGSKPWYPDPDGNTGIVDFVLSVRGQGLEEPKNTYGNWITWNLGKRDEYYYRGAFMDLIRAVDFVTSLPETDTSRIYAEGGSQGGAFTIAATALDSRIKAAAPFIPFLSDYKDYFKIVRWPGDQIVEAQKKNGITNEELYKMLSYFDIKNLAGWIKVPVIMGFGLQDEVCPPHINFAAYNNINAPKEYICFPWKGHDVGAEWWQRRMDFLMNSNRISHNN